VGDERTSLDADRGCHYNILLVAVVGEYPRQNGIGRSRLKQVVDG